MQTETLTSMQQLKVKMVLPTPVFAGQICFLHNRAYINRLPICIWNCTAEYFYHEASIKKQKHLIAANILLETWKALQTALTEAKEAKSANTQAIVDAANTKLTEALSGLKEKAVTPSKPATPSNPDTTTTKKPATKPALKKSNVKLSKPVLKVGKTTKNKAKVTWKKS